MTNIDLSTTMVAVLDYLTVFFHSNTVLSAGVSAVLILIFCAWKFFDWPPRMITALFGTLAIGVWLAPHLMTLALV